MRILYHSWEFGPGTGGIGQYMYQMACGLQEAGHEVVVVAGKEGNRKKNVESNSGRIYRLYEKNEVRTTRVMNEVLRIAEKHNIDIIEGADHWGECAPILLRQQRPKIAIKYHGSQIIKALVSAQVVYPWQRLTISLALLRIRKQCAAEKCCIETPDIAMMPSKKIHEDLKSQQLSLPSKLGMIPNILDRIPAINKRTEAPVPTILFVGRLEIRKGIQFFPHILRYIRQQFPNIVLEVAGEDSYARGIGSLQAWLKKKLGPLNENTRFLGKLSPVELDEAYRRCWLLVFPTKWDNFPMAVLEAMAHAKPVVTTPHGGMPDMLEGTGASIFLPDTEQFSNGIVELLGNVEKRRTVGNACRKSVIERYTPQRVIPQYLSFMRKCLA